MADFDEEGLENRALEIKTNIILEDDIWEQCVAFMYNPEKTESAKAIEANRFLITKFSIVLRRNLLETWENIDYSCIYSHCSFVFLFTEKLCA